MPIPEDQFSVWLSDRIVGVLHRRGDHTWYVMDPEYWADPARPVLGLRFEDSPGSGLSSALRLPAWFSNLLPEGKVRDWIARERGVSVHREMELLAQVGHDLPGAVRVLPADEELPVWAVQFAAADSALRAENSPSDVPWRFSLAGVGLKYSMLKRNDRLTLPSGGTGGDWIVKLPDARYRGVPRNEFAMMTLAGHGGIDVPDRRLVNKADLPDLPARVWPPGEDEAYAVRRFDRDAVRMPIHIEDLAQVRGFYPEDKYRGSFETVANLVYRGYDVAGLQEVARRLAFGILIGNGDAHLKNWSLIYTDPRRPNLSPAYDLVATAVYRRPLDGPEDLGLTFGRSRRFETVTIRTFERLQNQLGAKGAELTGVVEETVLRTKAAWPAVASILDPLPDIRDALDARITEFSARLLA